MKQHIHVNTNKIDIKNKYKALIFKKIKGKERKIRSNKVLMDFFILTIKIL